ncbi:hypothetical protein HAZT_HAZT004903 [Hyalella azteca]|nr:hypothetical protein HAZT_HAZT004903 [Hyalella azteca]
MVRRDTTEPTPICRCRVLYLGSAVPQVTKDGLQGIQEPLRELYPAEGAVSARGIDSWLSVWSNGLLLENVDENQKKVTRFFPIESLHYCAAVRYVLVAGGEEGVPRFLPLDSPFARNPNISHPPLFACIMRRTTGIKVLECHAFICKRETPANALVRCCFHSYADSMYVRSLEVGSKGEGGPNYEVARATEERAIEIDYTGDLSSANSEIIPATPGDSPPQGKMSPNTEDETSIFSGDENHKIWAASQQEEVYGGTEYGTMRSGQSAGSLYGTAAGSRPRRPRQMIMRSVAPPPPPSEAGTDVGKGKNKNKSKKDDDDMNRITSNGGPSHQSFNGSLTRPQNGHAAPKKGKIPRLFSSLADRKPKHHRNNPPFVMLPQTRGIMGPMPPRMMPPPHGHHGPHMMHPGPPPPMMMPPPLGPPPLMGPLGPPSHMGPPPAYAGPPGPPSSMGHHGPGSHLGIPGPTPYMLGPHGIPPAHMMPPQPIYGYTSSMSRRPSSRAVEEPIYMPSARPMSPTASYQPGHFPHERYLMQHYATTGRPNYPPGKRGKKKGNEVPEEIYGRRGHMNEKAFAQSIRAEQRARSYTSLAGLGTDSMNNKDREILQMVHDLDLSGDEIERAEPRPGVYRPSSATVASRNSRTSRR